VRYIHWQLRFPKLATESNAAHSYPTSLYPQVQGTGSIVTTLVAPVGVWLLQFVSTDVVWWIYVGVLVFLAYRMAFPPKMDDSQAPVITDRTRAKGVLLSSVIAVFAGFLGVGPGFLLMPSPVMLGYTARIAAATNSVIVTLPSFSAFATLCWLLCSSAEVQAIFDAKFARLGRVLRRKAGTQGEYTTNQTHNR
jgi:hypothetical protein